MGKAGEPLLGAGSPCTALPPWGCGTEREGLGAFSHQQFEDLLSGGSPSGHVLLLPPIPPPPVKVLLRLLNRFPEDHPCSGTI